MEAAPKVTLQQAQDAAKAKGRSLVRATRLTELQTTVGWLKKKADMADAPAPVLSTFGHVTVYFPEVPPVHDPVYGNLIRRGFPAFYEDYVEVTLEGTEVRINGWLPIGRIEQLPGSGVFVTPLSGTIEVPQAYRDRIVASSSPACEHCNLNRRRKQAYLLRHDDGRYLQVGTACLEDFTGHASPEELCRLAAAFNELDLRDPPRTKEWQPEAYPTEDILALAKACVKKFGWVSSRQARDAATPLRSTSSRVFDLLTVTNDDHAKEMQQAGEWVEATPEDRAEALALRDTVLARLDAQEHLDDFEHNLRTSLRGEATPARMMNVVCALFALEERYTTISEAKAKEQAARAAQKHVGKEGERLDLVLTLDTKQQLPPRQGQGPSGYGWGREPPRFIYKFHDADGNQFTWFSGESFVITIKHKDAEGKHASTGYDHVGLGDTIKVRATVKRHSEFRGGKETLLTRVTATGRVTSLDDEKRPVQMTDDERLALVREHGRNVTTPYYWAQVRNHTHKGDWSPTQQDKDDAFAIEKTLLATEAAARKAAQATAAPVNVLDNREAV